MNKKMLVKTAVAFGMIAVAVPVFILGGIPLQILLAAIAAMAGYETASLVFKGPNLLMTAANFAAIIAFWKVSVSHFTVICAVWLIILFTIALFDESTDSDLPAYSFLITMLTGLAVRCVASLYTDPKTAVYVFVYIALACFGCDTGAYFFGVFFGKHKMIPRVSPNKTWEGSVGGYVTGAVVSFLFGIAFCSHLPMTLLAAGSLILPAAAQIGDLSFSLIKRRFQIKDLGTLFPGHGGVLDRIDSIIFCLMVFNCLMILWGLA